MGYLLFIARPAAYHTRCQSVRRALRSLDDKENVRAFRDEGDGLRGWNYELT
jgi:hypothetical protein